MIKFQFKYYYFIINNCKIYISTGALVPHNSLINPKSMTTEPGALELACIRNNIKQVVVCGHSDCKVTDLIFKLVKLIELFIFKY